MTSETRIRSSSSPSPPPLDTVVLEPLAMEKNDCVVTRRSTRSFVESELDANLRELNASAADSTTISSNGTAPADNDNRRQALAVDTGVAGVTAVSTGTSTICTSTTSSSASSAHGPSALASPLGAEVVTAEAVAPAEPAKDNTTAADTAADAATEEQVSWPPGAPVNFGFVMPGIFRSSYPQPENFEFLSDLNLKTIVTLVDKNYTDEYRDFISDNGIQHHIVAMKGTKKEDIPLATMESILGLVLDRRNYPLLIHCNQGRHRTGCVVGIMRAIAGWDRDMVTGEYRAYAGNKVRDCDVDYIRAFSLADLKKLLARDDLQIDRLIIDSRVGGPLVGRPPPTTVGFRVPNFFRSTVFSMAVLLIWMVSGSRMPSTPVSEQSRN